MRVSRDVAVKLLPLRSLPIPIVCHRFARKHAQRAALKHRIFLPSKNLEKRKALPYSVWNC